jgi:hypothetical protein
VVADGSGVLSLEKLGQTFFAVIMTKTPLLMGFLVYELNCPYKNKKSRFGTKTTGFRR